MWEAIYKAYEKVKVDIKRRILKLKLEKKQKTLL